MSAVMKSDGPGLLDKAAIGISAICLVQCLALPVVVLLLPALSFGAAFHTLFHVLLLLVILPLSLAAFGLGWRRHGSRRVVTLGGIGLLLLVLAATLGHDVLGVAGETALTVAGGIALIIGHFLNLRLGRGFSPASSAST